MTAAAELAARAAHLAREGEAEGAGWAWYRAATLCADHDAALASTHLTAAAEVIAERDAPRLAGSIALLCSELALDSGDGESGAAASIAAERLFAAAGDERGLLAVWVARALRALRGGDPAAGLALCAWLLPRLDAATEPAPRLWLRLYAAEELRAQDRVVDAIGYLADALELTTPGTAEHMVVADRLTAAFLALDRPADAARIAVAAIDVPELGPPALRARLYQTLSTTLRAMAPGPLAELCAGLAVSLEGLELPDGAGAREADEPPAPTTRAIIGSLLGDD